MLFIILIYGSSKASYSGFSIDYSLENSYNTQWKYI